MVIFSPATGSDVVPYQQHWNKGAAMLAAWAQRESVPMLDMTPSFAGRSAAEVYFDGIHLKPLGHQLIEQAFLASEAGGSFLHR